MTPLALLHRWQTTETRHAVLAELDEQPNWPLELGVFLALELPPLATMPDPAPPLEPLAAALHGVLTRRFGADACERLWQAVTLLDLPNHTFVNQGYNDYFLMPRTQVERCTDAARTLAPVLVSALRLDPALLATFSRVADAVWSQYGLNAADALFEIVLASLPTTGEHELRFDIADCHYILATIYRQSRPHDARTQFHRFLELAPQRCPDNNWPLYPSYFPRMRYAPSSVAAWAEVGRLSLQLEGDRIQARACFLRAIRLDPTSQQAPHEDLGELHEQTSRIGPALHCYRRALEVRSAAFVRATDWRWEERPYRRALARLCLHMVPHVDPDEARALLRRTLQLDPDDAGRWLDPLAQIFEDTAELARQRSVCTQAIHTADDIPMDGTTAHTVKVDMRFRALFLEIADSFLPEPNGRHKALTWYQRVRTLDGDSPELLRRESACLETLANDLPRLLHLCELFLEIKPDDPVMRQRWTRAREASGPDLPTLADETTYDVLVLTPRHVHAAALAAQRLHHEEWLDTPFIFYHRPDSRLATIIVEDRDDFPATVMAAAEEITSVLRQRVVCHARPLPRWAFYPRTTLDGIEALLAKLGYRLLVPDLTHASVLLPPA